MRIDWSRIDCLVHIRHSDGAIVIDTRLDGEFPDLDQDALHRAIEDNVVTDFDGSEVIDWQEVEASYDRILNA